MHAYIIEDGAKPMRDAQKRLNPIFMEVVKKEVWKWLKANIIYPVLDSEWVCLVQYMPKWGMMVVTNEKELLPT